MSKSRNFAATVVLVTAPLTADSEFTVAHELDGTPRQGLVLRRSTNAVLYLSGTAWDTTSAYLKSSVASAQFYVLFFA